MPGGRVAGGGRRLRVPPERLGRWLDGVAERHGAFTEVRDDDGIVRITCADTTTVALRAPFGWTPGPALLASFTAEARQNLDGHWYASEQYACGITGLASGSCSYESDQAHAGNPAVVGGGGTGVTTATVAAASP